MIKKDFPHSLIDPGASLLLSKVSNLLAEQGIQAYVVGGFVRDVLLQREVADIDIAVTPDALEVAPKVATALGGKYVLLDMVNGLGRVVLSDKQAPAVQGHRVLDFSTFKSDIEQDLARRDFTIDAMVMELGKFVGQPLEPSLLIDPFNGWNDLRQGVIRAVTDTAFESDPARLLRAVRLAGELGFSIDNNTETSIRRHSYLVARVAGERIREEVLQLLAVSQIGQSLRYLAELGLLTTLIPELAQAKGSEQPKEHFWDVFDHSLETVAAVDFLLRQGVWKYDGDEVLAIAPWSASLCQYFEQKVSSGSTRGLLLKLAALLHDIAKPQTRALDANGRLRFLGHAQEGAAVAANILERLRFSAKEIKLVEIIVRHHLRPVQMSQAGLPSHRAIYRYFRDTGEAGIDTLFLSLADHLATRGPHLNLAQWQEHTQLVKYVLTQRFEQESLVVPPKLVDGHDLVNIFGMRPGPKVGEILESVREAQAAGELSTRQEALSYVDYLLSSSTLSPLLNKGKEGNH